jgi:Alkylmercury lyase
VVAVTPDDLVIRNATYRRFMELGRAPTPGDVAAVTGQGAEAVSEAWHRLHDAHALVLDDDGGIRMANPFSAVETPHRVQAAGRTWYANCGWDAFGIGVVLRTDSTVQTTCADCGEAIEIAVRDDRPTTDDAVFHVLVPAREWWTDIGYT